MKMVHHRIIVSLLVLVAVLVATNYFIVSVSDLLPARVTNLFRHNYFGFLFLPFHRPNVTNNETVCSLKLLRELATNAQYFSVGGRWEGESYVPNLCRPARDLFDEPDIAQCLRKRNITKLLFLGDSNGLRYFKNFLSLWNETERGSCQILLSGKRNVKNEFQIDEDYFVLRMGNRSSSKDIDLAMRVRRCSTCENQYAACTYSEQGKGNIVGGSPKEQTLFVEYLMIDAIVNNEVTTQTRKCKDGVSSNCLRVWSNTTQEFLLKEFLKDNYPDLILFFLNNHDKAAKTKVTMTRDTEYFARLLDTYLPRKVYFLLMSTGREVGSRQSPHYRDMKFENGTYDVNSQILRLNGAAYNVFKPRLLDSKRNFYSFFDLHSMSIGRDEWSLDGVHWQPIWYKKVVSLILQTFCAG